MLQVTVFYRGPRAKNGKNAAGRGRKWGATCGQRCPSNGNKGFGAEHDERAETGHGEKKSGRAGASWREISYIANPKFLRYEFE